ncbi:MAG TPA: hypothetical protein VG944_23040, partial [Fimbriimonas sp.]|nr:hypothetical protein [Fimbriimonas sp.]
MQLQIAGQHYDVGDQPIASGGEGEIYAISAASVAKVYYQNLRTTERRQKVLALCDSYLNFSSRHADYLIAFPEAPAYEGVASFNSIVGFSMVRYGYPTIAELGFDLASGEFNANDGVKFTDETAVAFVYALFDVVNRLHSARIILGDINPGNIECQPGARSPVIIDVDAAQIGGFSCPTTHEDYNDPRVTGRGGLGNNLFDFGSDVFALGVVCFEFLVGVRPHMLFVKPPKRDKENKANGVSSVKCWAEGRNYLAGLGISYFDCPENDAIEA